jgi:hypothetical protein
MQEIIVYRNPAEAALWNALTGNADIIFPILVAGIACVVTIVGVAAMTDKLPWRYRTGSVGKWIGRAQILVGALAALAVYRWLAI